MDLKSRYLRNPLDTTVSLLYAESLLQKSDFRSLEAFFRSTLPHTLNLNIWSLYVKYIGLQNPASLLPAYAHMISVMWFHYDIYDHIVEYIKLLDQDVDKIREVYTLALSNPIHNISSLFQQYEAWEISLSKVTYKSLVSERLATYQECFKLYQKLLPFISNLEFDNIFKILYLEPSNRKIALARHFKEKFYYKEEVYFLYNEILPDKEVLIEGIKNTNSSFLRMYFAMCYDSENILDLSNELEMICYLNIMAKRGADVFHDVLAKMGISGATEAPGMPSAAPCEISDRGRHVFDNEENGKSGSNEHDVDGNERNKIYKDAAAVAAQNIDSTVSSTISPYVLIYAARTEYSLTSDPHSAFKIFYLGINKSPALNEAFFKFLIDINDVCNIKAMFKILNKTENMWNWMINFEFKYGSFPEYRRLLAERAKQKYEFNIKEKIEKSDIGEQNAESYRFTYELFRKSFEFLDLRLMKDEVFENFVKQLPHLGANNVFQNLKSSHLISLLKSVDSPE
eukprot:jgi/Antlo1/590/2335